MENKLVMQRINWFRILRWAFARSFSPCNGD
jgi:hypothetical protein